MTTWRRVETPLLFVVVLAVGTVAVQLVDNAYGQAWSLATCLVFLAATVPLVIWSLYRTWLR